MQSRGSGQEQSARSGSHDGTPVQKCSKAEANETGPAEKAAAISSSLTLAATRALLGAQGELLKAMAAAQVIG